MSELRYFTPRGREHWSDWLTIAKDDQSIALPNGLLENPDCTRLAPGGASIETRVFTSKFTFAEALSPALTKVREARLPSDQWPGVWDWLALFYFDSICPRGANGKRKLKDPARYSYNPAWNRRYRHRVFGPAGLYMRLGDSSRLLIHGDATSLTDWEEQTASRYQIGGNKGIADALFRLYWDPAKQAPKRGAAPNSKKPGTLRRFGDLILQLDRTFDLMSISSTAILDLLPREFSKFREPEAK